MSIGLLCCLAAQALGASSGRQTVSLAGTWQVRLDPDRRGERDGWFRALAGETLRLPTTTDEAKLGRLTTDHPTTRLSRIHEFVGQAWYQREFDLPDSWRNKRVTLLLERTKTTTLWLDDQPLGAQDTLCGQQRYDLGDRVKPGRHRLTVRVDNATHPPLGGNHQLSDNTQTNWNGLLGRLELQATDRLWVEDVQVYPNVPERRLRVRVTLGNRTRREVDGRLTLGAAAFNSDTNHQPPACVVPFTTAEEGPTVLETALELGPDALLWSEWQPALYALNVALEAGRNFDEFRDREHTECGLREFRAAGTQFAINGVPTFLRGKHDACVFPLTGYAPMEVDGWLRYLRLCRDYGLNHVRFHSWCPPEAAFAAADRLGVYLQPELPNMGAFVGRAEHDDWCRAEGERILRTFGNHPSFTMFALGNELGGDQAVMADVLARFRALDPRHLYAQGSNNFFWAPHRAPADDYWTTFRTGKGVGPVRGSFATVDAPLGHIQAGPAATTCDFRESLAGVPVPVIGHEVGQFSVYPNFREIPKYTGVLAPRNLEHWRTLLAGAGLLDQADDFTRASGILAALCYREDVEAALRTPGFGGFQLLDLQDFPGQGTAHVGLLDAFMDSKGLIEPAVWRECCADSVPLLRFGKYAWTTGEQFTAEAQLAHYGERDLVGVVPRWSLRDARGATLESGELDKLDIPRGTLAKLGTVRFFCAQVERAPARLTLELNVAGALNHYPLWIYPESVPTAPPAGVTLAHKLDTATLAALTAGASVVLLPAESDLEHAVGGGFAPDFWCWPMFHNTPGTLGLLIDTTHPALAGFPTEFHSNWQWFAIASAAHPLVLDDTPRELRPLVQVIDNFQRVHRLGLVWEARVGAGRLLVCAADLEQLREQPAARQLLHSLLAYAGGPRFQPTVALAPEVAQRLLASTNLLRGATATADSSQSAAYAPALALDGDPRTRWCAADAGTGHWWQADLGRVATADSVRLRWEFGRRRYDYLLEGSLDGQTWTTLVDRRQNPERTQDQRVVFPAQRVRHVRLTVTGLEQGSWASLYEVRLGGTE